MTANRKSVHGLSDPRLAIHASSPFSAWLWTVDGTHILWANPVGLQLFGAARPRDLVNKTFGAADAHRRQIAQLAGRLRPDGTVRLERLRGFGAPLGRLATCACSRLTLADGEHAVLIGAMEPAARPMPLRDRLKKLVEYADTPLAAFGSDGVFVGASEPARALLGFRDLSEAGLDTARDDALFTGRAETAVGFGHLVLQRVGSGADVGLIALLDPASGPTARVAQERDEDDEEAHSEFLFVDEFDDEAELEPLPTLNQPDLEFASARQAVFSEAEAPPLENAPAVDISHEDVLPRRTEPLRFLWEIDGHDHFRVLSNELPYLIGAQAARSLDGPWKDVAASYASFGRMAAAIASEAAWSGVSLSLPTDNWNEPLTADLSGIPTYRDGEFSGYRGFGVIHDLTSLARLEAAREREARGFAPQSLSAQAASAPLTDLFDTPPQFTVELTDSTTNDTPGIEPVEHPINVVPIRPSAEGWSPALTPGENNAFNELARELSARLEAEKMAVSAPRRPADTELSPLRNDDASARALLELLPVPLAVYRGYRLLYANAAFIAERGHSDYTSLQAAPFDPAEIANAVSTPIEWGGERARALVVTPQPVSASSDTHAEDFAAILDAADDAILMFDMNGTILAGNRSAALLFGMDGDALLSSELASLFTADTQVAIAPLLDRLELTGTAHTVEARSVVNGREIPLRVRLGRARPESVSFYAIVHDLSTQKKIDADLAQARRQVERTNAEKADILARISHEMRSPLSAIIGFSDVMIEQRFGPLGSDRYADYLRDIRGCGERVVAIVDDLLDLSRIETGKRGLAPAPHDLNDLVEQCVLAMQPQANRERIIIRSSLAHPLPHVVADGAALRQIALNLIGNSIHLANPGGQVIVSTVHADSGDVLLRVRDTGHGLNDNEVASALAPFRAAYEDANPAQIRLALTRALAEANSARFSVKPAPYAGTLIEVAFLTA